MKKYEGNKKFLPEKYIRNMNLEIKKRERIDCIILFIVCMVLLPHTISIISNQKKETINENTENVKSEDINKLGKNESLNNSMVYINNIEEGNLNNGNGDVYIKGKEKLAEFINNRKIIVNAIEDLGEDEYKLQISEKKDIK